MKKEKWLPVVGFEKFYEVSNMGRVKQLKRYMDGKRGNCLMPETIKKLCKHKNGYITVCLLRIYRKLVHRLVAEAFLPNPNNFTDVNHIDWDKKNNTLDNLEWCSHKDNLIHAYKNPIALSNAKSTNKIQAALKSSIERAAGINAYHYKTGEFIGYFDSIGLCAKALGLKSIGNIYTVMNGRYKQYLGYTFTKVIKEHHH